MSTNKIQIAKRINEQLADIRKYAELLPNGKRHALINKCGKIAVIAAKAQAIADAPATGTLWPNARVTAEYDARTQEDIAAQARCKQAVFEAMLAGRVLSLRDGREFRAAEMHTIFCNIRRDIERKDLPYTLCDEWVRPHDSRPYKRYWLVERPQEGQEV